MSALEIQAMVDEWHNPTRKWVYSFLKQKGNEVYEATKDLLIINENDVHFMSSIFSYLLPIAYGMVIIYFLMDLIDKSTISGKGFTIEQFIFAMFKLILAESVLKFGADILGAACSLGNVFVNHWSEPGSIQYGADVGSAEDVINAYNGNLVKTISDWGTLECLVGCVVGMVINLVCVVPNLMIVLHAISRKFEIIIRGGLACLSLPDIFTEGKNSGCIRFIKKFFAVMIHGSIMVLIVSLSAAMQRAALISSLSNPADFNLTDFYTLLSPALYSFAAVGTISASKAFVNDALGV